jgi:hypothetical protein
MAGPGNAPKTQAYSKFLTVLNQWRNDAAVADQISGSTSQILLCGDGLSINRSIHIEKNLEFDTTQHGNIEFKK